MRQLRIAVWKGVGAIVGWKISLGIILSFFTLISAVLKTKWSQLFLLVLRGLKGSNLPVFPLNRMGEHNQRVREVDVHKLLEVEGDVVGALVSNSM